MITIIGFIIVRERANFDDFERTTIFDKQTFVSGKQTVDIYMNQEFTGYNTNERTEKIEYIVLHYTGINQDVVKIIDSYTFKNVSDKSADFFVNHNGKVYQYNTDIDNRFTWAVGGTKLEDSKGGTLNGIVTNNNSISVELATANKVGTWIFHEATLLSGANLIKYLMDKYDIDIDHVVRHYDVTGKMCPGVQGWTEDSGSALKWEEYKKFLNN